MHAWRFSALGRTYEVTDYGPHVGVQVLRDGFTVWTGYRQGGRFVTDTSPLPAHELCAVLEGLRVHAPNRRDPHARFVATAARPDRRVAGRPDRRATPRPAAPARAPVQLDLLGGRAGALEASKEALAAIGPLFAR